MSPAALCDLDGVLVDSGPVIERAWRRFARRTGLDAGRAAGARTVGVATTFPAGTLDADVVAASIADVLHLFG